MGLEIRPVKGALGRARFVGIPFRLFASDPQWTPPLRQSVRDRLSPRHPAAEHQRTRLWMAFQDGRPVGRIAACVDTMFNDYHGLAWAWVGFFECVDNPAVSAALFDAAWSWAAKEGMQVCVGPGSFTTNDEIGLLVEGREYPPALLTPHNPAYYEKLWVDAGWKQVMDLWGWRFGPHIPRLSERQQAALERLARRGPYRVRSASMRNFDAEVHRFFDIYNAAWSRNWGFAPMTHAEVSHLAKELRLIADPDLALFVELDSGETIAAALAVPDINQATARLRDGRLLPVGWLRLLLAQRRLTQARILLLGVRPEYETRGVGPLLYSALIQRLAAKPRMASAEASWTLATNNKINSAIEAIGATHHKTWRLYEHRAGLSRVRSRPLVPQVLEAALPRRVARLPAPDERGRGDGLDHELIEPGNRPPQGTHHVGEENHPVLAGLVPGFMRIGVVEHQAPAFLPCGLRAADADAAGAGRPGNQEGQVIPGDPLVGAAVLGQVLSRAEDREEGCGEARHGRQQGCRRQAAGAVLLRSPPSGTRRRRRRTSPTGRRW